MSETTKQRRRAPGGRTYRGRSPEERRAERRERLLEAGLKLFGGEGYAATSIERLCAHARVTARHFYEEFPTREALLLAVFDRMALPPHEPWNQECPQLGLGKCSGRLHSEPGSRG